LIKKRHLQIGNQNLLMLFLKLTFILPSSWYHARLDRFLSEDRLRKSNKIRCFLVRESISRPGNYVLSYFALDGTFNHYK
jgi:hypothetical protein